MIKVALAQINPIVGDLQGNCAKICAFIKKARKKNAEMVIFPELALCGYPPEDLDSVLSASFDKTFFIHFLSRHFV